jgi:hypothetical protein
MPQLDFYMFAAQSLFIFVFLLGYFLFVKYILPILSFEMKLKELLPLFYLNWFDQNQKHLYGSPYSFLELALLNQLKVILSGFIPYLKYVSISYTGVFYNDLLYLRSKYNQKVKRLNF